MESSFVEALVHRLDAWISADLARLVVAVALIVCGYALARLARYVATRLLRRASEGLTSFTHHTGNQGEVDPTPRPRTKAESAAIHFAGRAVFWLILVLFLGAGTTVLGFPVLSSWFGTLAGYLPRVLAAAAILLFGILSGLLARTVVTAAAESSGIEIARSLGRAAQIAIVALSVAIALEALGIAMTFVIVVAAVVLGTTLGAAGLAFGLGARTSVSNLLASHYLAKWYRPGQLVRIGEHEGHIIEILPGAVILKTKAGKLYVPANEFTKTPSILVDSDSSESDGE